MFRRNEIRSKNLILRQGQNAAPTMKIAVDNVLFRLFATRVSPTQNL